jgi:tRNA (guanine37-N1)-methyltransferase
MNIKGIKVNKNKAQIVIKKLKEEKLINNKYKIERDNDFVIIPVINNKDNNADNKNKINKLLNQYEIVNLEKKTVQTEKSKKLKDILIENKLPAEIINKINSAYDIVGDIIIIGIENLQKKHFEIIGKSLIQIHPHIKTILNKIGKHQGVFRTQNMEHIFGEKTKETIIKENNCKIKIDVEKVFCSTRLSFERARITNLVKKTEVVGVFFAGAGPFALTIAKNKNPKEVIGIELNPIAINYFKENIKLNKLKEKIKIISSDVKKISNNYLNYFNRIVMPLPKSADLFLDDAIKCSKNKAIIHIYRFVSKNDPYSEIENIINNKAEEKKIKLKIINKRIIRSYSPSIVQIVLDIKIEK